MADSDKDILITPQTSQVTDPSIVFSSGATSGDDVTLFVTDDGTITTLSFEGSAGQLLAISNDMTGTIFSVNDISGIPSIEVDADGTISLAEFDGEVGIGDAAPTEMLTITGRDVASSNAGIRVNARGDAYLKLYADTVSDTELENAYIYMSQDADAVVSVIGTTPGANLDSQNNTFTGGGNNSLGIHHKFATGEINLGVNGQVGLTIDDSNNATVVGDTFTFGSAGQTLSNSGADVTLTSQAGDIALVGGAETMLYATINGAVDIYHNNVVKLSTAADGIDVVGDMGSTTMQGLGYHASSGDAAPGADVWVRSNTNGYIYAGWINTVSGSTAAVPDRIYTNQGGGDGFIRYQTLANFNANVTSSATVAGDVTGTVGATVVGNDSHTHAFNNLTAKTSGTGNYTTTGDFTADNFEATGLGPNTTPGTDDGYFGGYGFLGDRAGNVYVSNVSGAVALNHTGVHNANVKLATTTSGVMITATAQATTFLSVTAGNGLYLYDSVKAAFGLGIDMTMYHNGTDNYIDSVLGTADLYIRTNSTENAIVANVNSSVDLYNNNTKTAATGVETFDVFANDSSPTTSSGQVRWLLADGTVRTYIGYSGSDTFAINSQVHGAQVYISGEDVGGTQRTILQADPDTTTILRADTNVQIECAAGELALHGTANAQVGLYHNGGLEFRTQQHEAASVTSGCETYDHSGTLRDVGFNHVKEVAMTTASIDLSNLHAGTIIRRTVASTVILRIEEISTTEFPVGSMCTVLNHGTGGSLTISDETGNLYIMDGSGTVTNSAGFALAIGGCITLWRQATLTYYVWGAGIP